MGKTESVFKDLCVWYELSSGKSSSAILKSKLHPKRQPARCGGLSLTGTQGHRQTYREF
ncbi:hypothetical protein HYU14_00425 [Candidatus Woesearchaeota archaeon]|nr:hypothetical protein [Candidatus Woesearchaeota archaeon]